MDSIMPSGGTYRVNARVNDIPIDEFSFISSDSKVQPFFDNAVSNDPDVTALMLFLKNSRGDIAGWKVLYTAENDINGDYQEPVSAQGTESDENNYSESDNNLNENVLKDLEIVPVEIPQNAVPYRNGDLLIMSVNNLDDELPYFPIPLDLPMGRYTLVSQVMSGDQVLYKTEKSFFFLSNAKFSFDGINVHHSGITENHQLISKGTVIMLEAKLDFDSFLDPYIVWYNGKRIISEGSFSQGTGNLLWKTPEQTGFFSIRAEIFPVTNRQGLAGFVKDISLLISSRTQDIHYISEDSPDLLHWYLLEGDLNDAKMNTARDRVLKTENIPLRWMPANGIFGLAAGFNNAYSLPDVTFRDNSDNGNHWKILSRFKPLDNGVILSAQFGSLSEAVMCLILDGDNLILSLTSASANASESLNLSEAGALETDSFITAEIYFSVLADHLTAKLKIILDNNSEQSEQKEIYPVSINAEFSNKYKIILGSLSADNTPINELVNSAAGSSAFTALWDELALFYMPFAEIEIPAEPAVSNRRSGSFRNNEGEERGESAVEKPSIDTAGEKEPDVKIKPEDENHLKEDNPLIAENQPVFDSHSIN